MGGSKNKSPAQKEKSQYKKSGSKKSKKSDKSEGGSPKAEITVTLTEAQASKFIKNAKVITAHELARQTGVKISAANAFLRGATSSGAVQKVGGHSGHYIYKPAA